MEVVLIAAVAANGVIGADGELPWHLPADLRHFKRTTTGHPVILGRRTYESIVDRIGGPLPDRTNVVLSRGDPDLPPDVVHAESVDAALAAARETGADAVYVAGGHTVYEACLDRADRLELTELDEAYEGDTYFPDWDRDDWCETARDARDGFAFVTYERSDER
jgi:dihydrofolate reductase